MFECHQVNYQTGQPVDDSVGVAAMGQIGHLGDRIYDSFFGNYILTRKEVGDRVGRTLGGNYYLDFHEDEYDSLFTRDLFTSYSLDEILFSATALEGVSSGWLDDDRFTCSYYIGSDRFDPTSFWHMRTINSDYPSFFDCYSEDDMLAYV